MGGDRDLAVRLTHLLLLRTTMKEQTCNTNLNDYHERRNARLVKEISEQRLMSRDECIAQARRLAQRTQKQGRKGQS